MRLSLVSAIRPTLLLRLLTAAIFICNVILPYPELKFYISGNKKQVLFSKYLQYVFSYGLNGEASLSERQDLQAIL